MRERSEKCVVTFRTTAGAMAMEAACKAAGLPGRLIPVPRSIAAGCGLCWAAPPDGREALEDLAIKKHLDVDGIYAIIL
ncbi:DUF3343 domain-containing protein [Oscillibacter sp.]|uniref:DUF3343 domain-containing protein n=1 Tax=Oscillibacter sp. TaxID=1945593 RepID=UPI002D80DF23|nr:DUF3343 domain-containing protein [Oscillibacter sp.]